MLATYHPAPSKPAFKMPAGACDSHCHIFGPAERFPHAANARYRPADAPKERLFALHDHLGVERSVIVQSACHGFDNSAVADAVAARPGKYLGVALCPTDVSNAEIDRLHRLGFRGVRFNFMRHLTQTALPEDLLRLATHLGDRGWHLQLHLDSSLMADMASLIAELPVTVVIDHMARIEIGSTHYQSALDALLRTLEQTHVWLKISALERASRTDAPWEDAVPLASRLFEAAPDRVVWGTDWPHPNFRSSPPDDGQIVDLLPLIAPTPALQQALLVDNPARLYGFDQQETPCQVDLKTK